MTLDEILEEIRTLLREPLAATVETPWTYENEDLIPVIRSAMRHLRSAGVLTAPVLSQTGELETVASERVGLLASFRVSSQLLTGDLTTKLRDGEMGTYWRDGTDILDTREAVKRLEGASGRYESEYRRLLAIELTSATDSGASMIGGSSTVNFP